MKCVGKLCPSDLTAINTPRFVIRAGIIPYYPKSTSSDGKILLGVKHGRLTDFGGGCKVGKMERPFDCAVREFNEESMGILSVDLKNTTHIFVSGKAKPHQVVLFVKVDTPLDRKLEQHYQMNKGQELEAVKVLSFSDVFRLKGGEMAESIKSISPHLLRAISM